MQTASLLSPDTLEPPETRQPPAAKRGILVKRGRWARWNKRFFLLEEALGVMTYFKSPTSKKASTRVFLGGGTLADVAKPIVLEAGKPLSSFEVQTSRNHKYYIVSEDPAELAALREAFLAAVQVEQNPLPTPKRTKFMKGVAWVVTRPLKLGDGVVYGLERIGDGVRAAPEFIFRSGSKSKERVPKSQPSDIAQGISQGASSALTEIFGAVAGLVIEPVRGAKRKGVKGATVGLGRGVVGLVCKPVAASINLVTSTVRGVQNTPRTLYTRLFHGGSAADPAKAAAGAGAGTGTTPPVSPSKLPSATPRRGSVRPSQEERKGEEAESEEEDEGVDPHAAAILARAATDPDSLTRREKAEVELLRLQELIAQQAAALQQREAQIAAMKQKRQTLKATVSTVMKGMHPATGAPASPRVVHPPPPAAALSSADSETEEEAEVELKEEDMTAEQVQLKRSLEALLELLSEDEDAGAGRRRSLSADEPDDLDGYVSAEEGELPAGRRSALEPAPADLAAPAGPAAAAAAVAMPAAPSPSLSDEEDEAKSAHPGARRSVLDEEREKALALIWNWQLPGERDDYRLPCGYSDGGVECQDQVVVKKLRSVGKEMLKQIGRKLLSGSMNLTAVSFPIQCMKPATALQTVAAALIYVPLYMNRAAETADPVERMKLVICSFLSSFHYTISFMKPINPILGETWEATMADGTKVYMEQTSHHPPVTHWQAVGPENRYVFGGYSCFAAHAGLNSVSLSNNSIRRVTFADGGAIEWNSPNDQWSGTFMGVCRQEVLGPLEFVDRQHGVVATLRIGKVKGRASDYFEGQVKVNDQVVSRLAGTYLGYIEFDQVRYWDVRTTPMFEITPVDSPLPSDSLLRGDVQNLLMDNIPEAQRHKEALENMQRQDAKLRKAHDKDLRRNRRSNAH